MYKIGQMNILIKIQITQTKLEKNVDYFSHENLELIQVIYLILAINTKKAFYYFS